MKTGLIGLLVLVALLNACSGADKGLGPSGGATLTKAVAGSEADLVGNVGDRVFFAVDESRLSSDAQTTLDRQVSWLMRNSGVAPQIAGNSDDRGPEEYNIALGERRANSVRDYLVARDVSSGRISTISYGKDRPTMISDDGQSWQQNRNAITLVR